MTVSRRDFLAGTSGAVALAIMVSHFMLELPARAGVKERPLPPAVAIKSCVTPIWRRDLQAKIRSHFATSRDQSNLSGPKLLLRERRQGGMDVV
jgi:hypothetical protein